MKSKKKAIIIISIVAILIIIAIIGIYVFEKNKDKGNLSGENTDVALNEQKGTETLKPVDMNNLENAKIEDKEKVNTSEEIMKEREVGNLKLTNIVLKTDDNTSLFTADVENTSEEDYAGGELRLRFQDNSGNNFAILEASVPPIKSKEKSQIAVKTTADIVYAKDFSVEVN